MGNTCTWHSVYFTIISRWLAKKIAKQYLLTESNITLWCIREIWWEKWICHIAFKRSIIQAEFIYLLNIPGVWNEVHFENAEKTLFQNIIADKIVLGHRNNTATTLSICVWLDNINL